MQVLGNGRRCLVREKQLAGGVLHSAALCVVNERRSCRFLEQTSEVIKRHSHEGLKGGKAHGSTEIDASFDGAHGVHDLRAKGDAIASAPIETILFTDVEEYFEKGKTRECFVDLFLLELIFEDA